VSLATELRSMLLRLLIRAANTGAEVRSHAAALAAAFWPAQLYA
jgi:hypothetical protein